MIMSVTAFRNKNLQLQRQIDEKKRFNNPITKSTQSHYTLSHMPKVTLPEIQKAISFMEKTKLVIGQ